MHIPVLSKHISRIIRKTLRISGGFGLLIVLLGFTVTCTVSAHPLDISSTTLTIGGGSINAVTYFHPSQVETTLGRAGMNMRSLTYGDYYSGSIHLYDYVRNHVRISDSQGRPCALSGFSTQELWVDDIFVKGFPIAYQADCKEDTGGLKYEFSIYTELPLQTNRVLIYDRATGRPLSYKVLTSKIIGSEYIPGQNRMLSDRDGDRLPDEEESVYRTDPENSDTDGDYYSDYEEVMSGWNPLVADVSPGQSERRAPSDTQFQLPLWIAQSGTGIEAWFNTHAAPLDNSAVSDGAQQGLRTLMDMKSTGIFRSVLEYLERLRAGGMTTEILVPALWLIFILWFFHALWPGHSKWFMAGYILSGKVGVGKSLWYAGIFTLVHLTDVVVVVLLSRYLFEYFDPTRYLGQVERIAVSVLLFISIWYMIRSVRFALRARRLEYTSEFPQTNISVSGGLWMAFFAGLAPCTFAWSIMLVLFSIGRTDLALPFLLAFWWGIFSALSLIALAVYFVRERIYSFAGAAVWVIPLFSSILLLSIAGLLAANIFL